MIKQLILLVQVLGLFFYQLVFTGDLAITQKIPEIINQDTEAVVEITIQKDEVAGFAKVQQDCPDGFVVELIDSKGATFSFKDNKIKFIWMSLPQEREFKISYRIKPKENVKGEFNIGGKFSFVLDNERKNLEIPISRFKVVGDEVAVVDNIVLQEESQDSADTGLVKVNLEDIHLECSRTIETIDNGKYKVTLQIDKKGIEGFAKITERIPAGFIAKEEKLKGGVFSFKNNEVKILWLSIPEEEKYVITYYLEANKLTKNGMFDITGSFSYLKEEVTIDFPIESSSFELDIKEQKEVVKNRELLPETTKDSKSLKSEVVSIIEPESGVNYKVQVGAGHKMVASNYFLVKFNVKDKVSTINHQGWIKYLIGSYDQYKVARDERNKLRSNVKTAFVTAYNSDKRITVQEALMISNQKWYK